jgi:hypothetical protein
MHVCNHVRSPDLRSFVHLSIESTHNLSAHQSNVPKGVRIYQVSVHISSQLIHKVFGPISSLQIYHISVSISGHQTARWIFSVRGGCWVDAYFHNICVLTKITNISRGFLQASPIQRYQMKWSRSRVQQIVEIYATSEMIDKYSLTPVVNNINLGTDDPASVLIY